MRRIWPGLDFPASLLHAGARIAKLDLGFCRPDVPRIMSLMASASLFSITSWYFQRDTFNATVMASMGS